MSPLRLYEMLSTFEPPSSVASSVTVTSSLFQPAVLGSDETVAVVFGAVESLGVRRKACISTPTGPTPTIFPER